MVKQLSKDSGAAKQSKWLTVPGYQRLLSNGCLRPCYKQVGHKRGRCCWPAGSMLRSITSSWVQKMRMEGLNTCEIRLLTSHIPNNTVRSRSGPLPQVVKPTSAGSVGRLAGHDGAGWGTTCPWRPTVGMKCRSHTSPAPSGISEFRNKLFHSPKTTMDLASLLWNLWP